MADAAKYRIAKELDVPAEMRDGTTLFADVYRPDAESNSLAISAITSSLFLAATWW